MLSWQTNTNLPSELCTDMRFVSKISPLLSATGVLESKARKIVLSGPSGFLGSHVLDAILEVHQLRKENALDPGEVILLSSSPGNMMKRLQAKYGPDKMKTIRASRVDYFSQHQVDPWRDQLGSLGKYRLLK